ncbi:cytochrome P450 [Streptomyces sp. NPDC003032]
MKQFRLSRAWNSAVRTGPDHDHLGATGSHIPTPPGAWPLAGHTIAFVRRPLDFIASLSQHGDLVQLRLGTLPVYAATHPALVHQILVTDGRNFVRGRFFDKAAAFLGESLATASGPEHRRKRRMLQPGFRAEQIARFFEPMCAAAESLATGWTPGRRVIVDEEMNHLALTVVIRTLFSTGLSRDASAAFHHALPILARGAIVRTALPDWFNNLPLAVNRRFDHAVQDLRTVIHQAIAGERHDTREHHDLLSILLAARDDAGHRLTDQQVVDQVVTFVTAGVETTAATLTWIFHELGRHPDIEERLHAELDRVLGDRPLQAQDLPTLDLTGRIIAEALRLYPPWLFTRRALAASRLGDGSVPAGAEILYSPYAIHRDPRWYANPARFDPDRWLPSRAASTPPGAYLPFGLGPHKCIGYSFAHTEIAIALACICRRWSLRPVPGVPSKLIVRADVHPDTLPMTAQPRHPVPGTGGGA